MAFPRAKNFIASTVAASMLNIGALPAAACTAMIFKAQDGTSIYARTMEWGATDLKSELVMVPRGTSFAPVLGGGITGMAWKNAYGFVGVNASGLPYATDGMNEAGLTFGALYYPGFAQYQEPLADQQAVSIGSVDMGNYLLGNFKSVDEIKTSLPKVRSHSQSRDREGLRRTDSAALCRQRRDRRFDRDRIYQGGTRHFRQPCRGDD